MSKSPKLRFAKIYKFFTSFINETVLAGGSEHWKVFFLFSTMSFALYLEFTHSLHSFEFIKIEKLSRQEINFHSLLFIVHSFIHKTVVMNKWKSFCLCSNFRNNTSIKICFICFSFKNIFCDSYSAFSDYNTNYTVVTVNISQVWLLKQCVWVEQVIS